MTEIIAIEGGHKLNGTVVISGAKNATVALIPATVLADGPVTIYGVPEISDVDALGVLLKELNCEVELDEDTLNIDPTNLENIPLIGEAVDKLRASYYLMGALLGKCKKVVKCHFCLIGEMAVMAKWISASAGTDDADYVMVTRRWLSPCEWSLMDSSFVFKQCSSWLVLFYYEETCQ